MDDESTTDWVRRCAKSPGAEWRLQTRDGERLIERSNEGLFDELVVDHWLHLEQLGARTWWGRVGDARLQISISEDGAVTLDVERGAYAAVRGMTDSRGGGDPDPG